MSDKIFPMWDNVLLAEDKASSTTTASGIVVEGNMGDTPTYTVLAVGPDVKKVSAGDKTYVKFDNTAIIVKSEGMQRVVVQEEKIVAVVGK